MEEEEEDRPGFGLKVLGGASPCLRRAFTYLEERGLGGEEERRRGGEGIPQWSPSSLPAGLQHLISSSLDRCCLPYLRTVGL